MRYNRRRGGQCAQRLGAGHNKRRNRTAVRPNPNPIRLTSPRRRWFGPSSSGSRPSRCTSCNRFGRTCTSCTCIRVRVRVRPSRRAEQPQGAPHASDYALSRTPKRAATPQLVAGGRPKRPPQPRDYDWAPNLQPTTTRFGQAVGASQGSACRPFAGSRRPCSRRRAPAHRCSRYTTTRRRCPRAR